MRKVKTTAETSALCAEVHERVLKGESIVLASKAVGTHPSNYYGWRKRMDNPVTKPPKSLTAAAKKPQVTRYLLPEEKQGEMTFIVVKGERSGVERSLFLIAQMLGASTNG